MEKLELEALATLLIYAAIKVSGGQPDVSQICDEAEHVCKAMRKRWWITEEDE